MTDDRIATLRRALTEQEDDTDFQLKERLKAEDRAERAERGLAATKEALTIALNEQARLVALLDAAGVAR